MMDNIEKIKAELERRISRCEKKHPPLMSDKDFTDEENEIYCEERAYREILSFIDSLQDEPIVKDSKVSEEIDQNFTKSSDDDLDEVAQRIAYDVCKQLPNGEEKDGIVYYAILAAIAGAEWMAGQGYTRRGIARPDDCEIWVNIKNTDIKDGDKVVVQIRKK